MKSHANANAKEIVAFSFGKTPKTLHTYNTNESAHNIIKMTMTTVKIVCNLLSDGAFIFCAMCVMQESFITKTKI